MEAVNWMWAGWLAAAPNSTNTMTMARRFTHCLLQEKNNNSSSRIAHISAYDREVLFVFQRISVTIQRFNSVLLHDSFSINRPSRPLVTPLVLIFLTLGILTTNGI